MELGNLVGGKATRSSTRNMSSMLCGDAEFDCEKVEMCSKCKTKVNTTIEMNLYPVRKIPAVGSIYYPLYIYIPSHHTLNPTPKISKLYMSDVGVSIEDAREVARRSERAEALA